MAAENGSPAVVLDMSKSVSMAGEFKGETLNAQRPTSNAQLAPLAVEC
jgi:hypothetical protein